MPLLKEKAAFRRRGIGNSTGSLPTTEKASGPITLELAELGLDRRLVAAVIDVGELEEDETEDRGAVFRSLEVGIGAEVVGGRPEVVLKLLELVTSHLCPMVTVRWVQSV